MDRRRHSCAIAVASVLLVAFVADCAELTGGPARAPDPPPDDEVVAETPTPEPFGPPRPDPPSLEVAWAKALPPLHVECANTGAKTDLRLYDGSGSVDPAAVDAFSLVASDSNGAYPLHERLVRLAVKAARHFDARTLVVVSAYRKPHGKAPPDHHAKGEALDFRLPGVDYRKLAVYLRSLPRVGVGVYTDPRTQYVHLDVRDRSFHWLDASPPGVRWREAAIPDPKQAARDAAYTEESDLPLDRSVAKR
jgi:hypothetical protein